MEMEHLWGVQGKDLDFGGGLGGCAGATEAPGHCDSPEHLCKDAGTTQAHAVTKDACCPTHTHALTPRRVPACVFFLFHQLYRRKKSQENQEKHQTCYSDLASGTSQIHFSQHDTSPFKTVTFPGLLLQLVGAEVAVSPAGLGNPADGGVEAAGRMGRGRGAGSRELAKHLEIACSEGCGVLGLRDLRPLLDWSPLHIWHRARLSQPTSAVTPSPATSPRSISEEPGCLTLGILFVLDDKLGLLVV